MKVLTEDDIRHLIREGKVYDKNLLLLNDEMIITPSADSFLREHQIQIKIKEPEAAETIPVEQLNFSECFKTLSENIEINTLNLSFKRLHQLLYLPTISEEQLSVLEKKQLVALQADVICFYQPLGKEVDVSLGNLSQPKKGVFRLTLVSPRILNAAIEAIEIQVEEIKRCLLNCFNHDTAHQARYGKLYQQFEQWVALNLKNLQGCAVKGREK